MEDIELIIYNLEEQSDYIKVFVFSGEDYGLLLGESIKYEILEEINL